MASKKPFLFRVQLNLLFLTGLRASNVLQLKEYLRSVPDSSVYCHTHNFLQRHHFLIPEPPNDFAYWVAHVLNETKLGEELYAIDTVRFNSLTDLKEALLAVMDAFLEKNPSLRVAQPGSEFHFMKATLFNLPTHYEARNLNEFVECLKKVSIHSIYYHMFEGRLRTAEHRNDFSVWLSELGEETLAKKIERLDPYTHTIEELRTQMIRLMDQRIKEEAHAAAI